MAGYQDRSGGAFRVSAPLNVNYPDDRVIAWVNAHGDNGEQKRIPWLRYPKTPEELQLSEQASRIIRKAQDQQNAQAQLSGKQRRHKNRRLRQFCNRLRSDP
jgi:hypothetical protein